VAGLWGVGEASQGRDHRDVTAGRERVICDSASRDAAINIKPKEAQMKTKTKAPQVSVSARAVLARVNRKLAAEGSMLRRCRQDSRNYDQLGDYYMVNLNSNGIFKMQCELEEEARELGVLGEWEVLAE
jgi:hypothetical protein